ncbi:serine hydroxymethyltransferase [Candidatus Purcelliella pentastirinorum]|uniref:serine hydroxymethyltransferase n=1 Tax=Candidatus Purcelliella pentastirinorum TaxID=472834 RepID=UPI00236843BB|nr:serine hydroxymethyltransferase [Candidatus Purcelliella pentastirinorum]WDI79045.1 serine hydroxymethyltransferase [Candidatus Purcelliella pentastirinorum]WDR80183.1 serine hydroxymethyltransferase [Candidatus Purcelliella pentastirinorum]
MKKNIDTYDNTLWKLIQAEKKRQNQYINLIASENYVSNCVMQAQGSILTNKYAEGYPNKRFYSGCKYIDIIETIAIERAKKLFNADYVNVQPHSGTQANFAAYNALINYGDTILSMKLTHGGHLSHGAKMNSSGKLYKVINYGLNKKGDINYKEIHELSKKYKPKLIIAGFSSYSGIFNWKKIRKIADINNSYLLVDMAHIAGLVAAKLYPNPLPYAHVVTTTTHKTLSGPRGGMILAKGGNKILYDKLDRAIFPREQGGPLMHIIAAKAVAFKEAMEKNFKLYQKQTIQNAITMTKIFIKKKYKIVSGCTKNHMFLINLSNKNITGLEASNILYKANIVTNKNFIPNDKKNATITSGIRIGTPAITKRGFKKKETKKITYWITDILNNIKNKKNIIKIKKMVKNLCNKFPIYK